MSNRGNDELTLKQILEKVSDAVETDKEWIEFVMAWQSNDPLVSNNKESSKELLEFLITAHKKDNPQADYNNKKVVSVCRRYNLSIWSKCLMNGIKSVEDLSKTDEDKLEEILNTSNR